MPQKRIDVAATAASLNILMVPQSLRRISNQGTVSKVELVGHCEVILKYFSGRLRPKSVYIEISTVAAAIILLAGNLSKAEINGQENEKSVHPRPDAGAVSVCDPSRFKIALDIGHTIQASGATSARGVAEYTFNSILAKRIAESLRDAGYRNTYLLTATGTGKVQLEQRAARANALGVNLFLSIHHDDVQPIYYSTWQHNGKSYHYSDRFSGYSLFVSYQNRYASASLTFAKLLGSELLARGMRFSLHHSENIRGEGREVLDPERGIYRYDHLFVLKNTFAPAVLLEAGVIVNRGEEVILASPERQNEISAAVLTAMNEFCATSQSKMSPRNR
jgi:N-acetylmuramoyl-L-alanine amidase